MLRKKGNQDNKRCALAFCTAVPPTVRNCGTNLCFQTGAKVGSFTVVLSRETSSFHSSQIDEVLLCSPIAERAIAAGVEIQPSWANGAKVFVKDILETKLLQWDDWLCVTFFGSTAESNGL